MIPSPNPPLPESLHFFNYFLTKENQADLEEVLHAFEIVYVNCLAQINCFVKSDRDYTHEIFEDELH